LTKKIENLPGTYLHEQGGFKVYGFDRNHAGVPEVLIKNASRGTKLTFIYGELLNDGAFGKLGLALEENRNGDAFEYAHNLKGIIGNMGLTPLFETVCEIVEPLRVGSMDGVLTKYYELLKQREYFSQFI
jgi:hypothetical protein